MECRKNYESINIGWKNMNNNDLNFMFSKKSDHWKTPTNIYNHYMNHNYFDPCPYHSDFDGLQIEWKQYNFVNPPYSNIEKWVDKCIAEALKGNEIVLLIPSRTETKYFQKLLNFKCSFHFFNRRLSFNDIGTAPFPSVLVIISKYINENSIESIDARNYI